MTSPFQIRQSNSRPQGYLSRSVDTNYVKRSSCNNNNYNHNSYNSNVNSNTLGLEYSSFDSTRTDLSANSRDVIIGEQWVVLGRIGEGSFGEVFEAEDVDTGRRYAIKREPLKMHHPQIKHESNIYDVLAGGPGIPQCHWHGQHEGFDCIVLDLLGPNLNQLRETTKSFPLEVVVDFGCQMVTILEHIHKRGLVYRDVKPDNFLFSAKCHLPEPEMVEIPDDHGMPHIKYIHPSCEEIFKKWNEEKPKIYIVDFGLTTWWRNPTTDKTYPEAKKNIKNKTGTARYASLNVHRGKPHSRRDDIESMGYLLLDLIFGTLPWTGIQARNSRAGWDRMRQIKEDTFMSDLCAGLPQGLLEFIEYARKIRFTEEPNYELLRQFLSGSIHGGKYSKIVRSPFGGHTERKWQQDIDKEKDEQLTHEDIPRPYRNNNTSNNQEHIPRQRKTSYNNHHNHNHNQHNNHDNTAGVFDMDDLSNNLPPAQQPQQQQQHQYSQQPQQHYKSRGAGVGGGANAAAGNNNNGHSNGININYNRRTSRDYGRNNNNNLEPPTTTCLSSFQKLVMKNKERQKRVGWNSHNHDEAPWIPATDWETAPADKPNINITHASWGEDKSNGLWNNKPAATGTTTLGIEEKEDSWAAKVEKPWE